MAGILLIISQKSTLCFSSAGSLWIWLRFGLSLFFFLESKDFFIITWINNADYITR
jgi:hypothetical protein